MTLLPNSGSKGLPAESRRTRVQSGILLEHHNKLLVDDFSRGPQSHKQDNTLLLHFVHSDDLKYVDIFWSFFNVFFQRFVV
jgi:hypothetical protein